MRSFVVGKLSEFRRLSLDSEGINLYEGRGIVVLSYAQDVQLHEFATGVLLMKGLRETEE